MPIVYISIKIKSSDVPIFIHEILPVYAVDFSVYIFFLLNVFSITLLLLFDTINIIIYFFDIYSIYTLRNKVNSILKYMFYIYSVYLYYIFYQRTG